MSLKYTISLDSSDKCFTTWSDPDNSLVVLSKTGKVSFYDDNGQIKMQSQVILRDCIIDNFYYCCNNIIVVGNNGYCIVIHSIDTNESKLVPFHSPIVHFVTHQPKPTIAVILGNGLIYILNILDSSITQLTKLKCRNITWCEWVGESIFMLVDKTKILSVANGRDPIYHSSFKENVQYVAYVKNSQNSLYIGFMSSLLIINVNGTSCRCNFNPPFNCPYTFKYITNEQKIIFKTQKSYFMSDINYINTSMSLSIIDLSLDCIHQPNYKYEVSNQTGTIIGWNESNFMIMPITGKLTDNTSQNNSLSLISNISWSPSGVTFCVIHDKFQKISVFEMKSPFEMLLKFCDCVLKPISFSPFLSYAAIVLLFLFMICCFEWNIEPFYYYDLLLDFILLRI